MINIHSLGYCSGVCVYTLTDVRLCVYVSVGHQVVCLSVSIAVFRGFNRDLTHTQTHTQTDGINTLRDKHPQTDTHAPQIYARSPFQLSSVLGLAGSYRRAGVSVYSGWQVMREAAELHSVGKCVACNNMHKEWVLKTYGSKITFSFHKPKKQTRLYRYKVRALISCISSTMHSDRSSCNISATLKETGHVHDSVAQTVTTYTCYYS